MPPKAVHTSSVSPSRITIEFSLGQEIVFSLGQCLGVIRAGHLQLDALNIFFGRHLADNLLVGSLPSEINNLGRLEKL